MNYSIVQQSRKEAVSTMLKFTLLKAIYFYIMFVQFQLTERSDMPHKFNKETDGWTRMVFSLHQATSINSSSPA